MRSTPLSYYLFTSPHLSLDIAMKWFEHFREKGMAACVTEHLLKNKQLDYCVWVEFDPALFGNKVVDESERRIFLYGKIIESCGGFKERLDKDKRLAVRHKYGPDPVILSELSKFGGGE